MKKPGLFSKWFIIPVILVAMAATIILGNSWSIFSDTETSNVNTMGAWTSANWTQTTQADFDAGVKSTGISTSANSGYVQLVGNSTTSFAPTSNATGNWTSSNNSYVSDNLYATESPNVLVLTNNPTTNTTTGSGWITPANAYTAGAGVANITSNATGYSTWGNYGFVLGNNVTTNVSVRYDAWATAPNITYRGAGANATGTTNVTCSQPTGTATNDVLLAFIIDRSTVNGSSTAPTGWQNRGYAYSSGNRFQVFSAVVGSNGLTGTSWNFSGLYTQSLGVIFGFYNVDTTGFGGLDTTVSTRYNASGTYGTAGITTVTNNTMIVGAFGRASTGPGSVTWTAESCATIGALTELAEGIYANQASFAIADKLMSNYGPTGNSTATPSAAGTNLGILLALKPATPNFPQIQVSVTSNNGTTWSSNQTQTLTGTNTTYWYDVTSAATWNTTTLNNTNFKVRVGVINTGTVMPVNLDWLPVVVSTYNASVLGQQYSNYGINLTPSISIQKVEVGIEAFATSSDRVSLQVTANNGTTWSTVQNSSALPGADANTTTWFDFTSAASWTAASLNNTNFKVLIQYLNDGLNDETVGTVSLDYIPVRISYLTLSGNISSQVFNTTVAGSTWDGLAWDSTLNSGGNITFAVRASDTSFAANATTPAWTSNVAWATNGSTTVIISSLPAGQYKQWCATLNTTNNTTPVLAEVRVYYNGP